MNTGPSRDPARVGSTTETAVIVQTLWAEYVWLAQHHTGWTVVRHGELLKREKTFDVLELESPAGDRCEVYFDISGCHRHKPPPTPPCPYCGAPLVTPKAKQCRRCFADFHDPEHVVYRKGRGHLEQVRSGVVRWADFETGTLELRDPRAAFTTLFGPSKVTDDVVILRFPPRFRAQDERLFTIGVDFLSAEGCRGFVCDLDQPLRDLPREMLDRSKQITRLLTIVFGIPGAMRRVVLLRGEGFVALVKEPMRVLDNYGTEELAVTALISRLAGSA